ncbi:BnaC02g25440D [Brassica napus]|uniref:BnaC02g25440D protein n=1 Tax=Brassica napus TaxID=3708 RepID=A0A078G704_BRANA|nr:BnaC02g25440D [Brassica napus]
MASTCVHNVTVSAYGCFNARSSGSAVSLEMKKLIPPEEEFEFRTEVPVGMLPADKLFSNGKLVTTAVVEVETGVSGEEGSLVSSPKAPRCSSKWRELLGLKRFSQNSKAAASKTSSSSSDASSLISLPLLSDIESLSVSSSSRMSLSSSSSSSDTPRRLSLDAERLNHLAHQNITANPFAPARPRMRLVKQPRDREETCSDSPRLNSSGKIVFQSLERSSSSPRGGGYRNRGVERSYSVNLSVAPVLNVPVCSVRGGSVIFSHFFSSASSQHNKTGNGSNHRALLTHHQHGGISRGRNSTDRLASSISPSTFSTV